MHYAELAVDVDSRDMAGREGPELRHQEVACSFFDHSRRNRLESFHVGVNEGVFAEQIHHPWDAARIMVECLDGVGLEDRFARCAGDAQPVRNVSVGLLKGERRGVATERNPLPKLPHFRLFQLLFQLGLTDKDNLQKFFGSGLQIQQKADLLQQFERKALGFVDDQDGRGAGAEAFDQPLVEFQEHITHRP